LKVLLVHPRIFAGGAEKAIVYLAYHLNKLGHEAVVSTLSADIDDLPPLARKVCYLTPEKSSPPREVESVKAAFHSVVGEVTALRGLVKDYLDDYDLLAPCNFPAYWATYACRSPMPVVWTSSEVFGPYNASRDSYDRNRFFRLAVDAAAHLDKHIVRKSVDAIITCSELNRQLIRERYKMDAAVIPTAVDYEFFSGSCHEAREELGLGDGYVLLHVGTLVKRKNQVLSIRALHFLRRRIPGAKLIIVGEGPWEPILRNEARDLALDQDVVFVGRVSEEKLKLLYHACDVNLYPVEDQTYGLVPFEAFAAGKPSLVSEDSGAGLLMAEEGLGILIRPEVNSIVQAVLETREDQDGANELVEKGRAYVKANLTWNRYADRTARLYEDILSSASVSGLKE